MGDRVKLPRAWGGGVAGSLFCRTLMLLAGAGQLLAARSLKAQETPATQQAGPTRLVQREDGRWQLLRNGVEFRIRGAGGEASLELLAELGGNSGRTWGVDDSTLARLDEAGRHGVALTLGIWLEHEGKGFRYDDPGQTAQQLETVIDAVERYRNHPALLMWGIGNEMEGPDGSNRAVWNHIESIASRIKAIDPDHPVMTVIAEIGGGKVAAIQDQCPSIDVIGINSYGGAASLAQRYREAGGRKPYVVTEFGPHGPWETGRNAFGAVEEETSTAKASQYQEKMRAIENDTELCLGSYAFLWGHKQEATATWFGMLLADGSRTAAADTMTAFWRGRPAENLCPAITAIAWRGTSDVLPGEGLEASLQATDPGNDPLSVQWLVLEEAGEYITGGDFQKAPPQLDDVVVEGTLSGATVKAPAKPGIYRLYVFVRDGHGGVATGNLPFRVRSQQEPVATAALPCAVYADGSAGPWHPAGWMGNTADLTLDPDCGIQPHAGTTCLQVRYGHPREWAGVVWQDPPGDWGQLAGGRDLTQARQLTFWARGSAGGEKIRFGVGLVKPDQPFPDSGLKEIDPITLETDWKSYRIDLNGIDLGCIKSAFWFSFEGQGAPLEFWLDDITFE